MLANQNVEQRPHLNDFKTDYEQVRISQEDLFKVQIQNLLFNRSYLAVIPILQSCICFSAVYLYKNGQLWDPLNLSLWLLIKTVLCTGIYAVLAFTWTFIRSFGDLLSQHNIQAPALTRLIGISKLIKTSFLWRTALKSLQHLSQIVWAGIVMLTLGSNQHDIVERMSVWKLLAALLLIDLVLWAAKKSPKLDCFSLLIVLAIFIGDAGDCLCLLVSVVLPQIQICQAKAVPAWSEMFKPPKLVRFLSESTNFTTSYPQSMNLSLHLIGQLLESVPQTPILNPRI